MRYGAVSYLNARPLVEGLDPLLLDVPARLVERFEDGEFDVALLPVVAGEASGRERVGTLGVAADGPVESVLLFHDCPPDEIRTVRLDPASRTSRLLALILLQELYGVRPDLVDRATEADAELVIGDSALFLGAGPEARLDLAEEWKRWTGLPFVFAAWYGDPRAGPELEAAYERGRGRLARYASECPLDLPRSALERYLSERIRFRLGEREQEGLARFLETARRLGLL